MGKVLCRSSLSALTQEGKALYTTPWNQRIGSGLRAAVKMHWEKIWRNYRIIPDANLLIYPYTSDSPFHAKSKRWLKTLLSGGETAGLVYSGLFSFIRIPTNFRIFQNPLPVPAASSLVNNWVNRSIVTTLTPYPDSLKDVNHLRISAESPGGNIVTDAQISASALHYRGIVHTADTDFIRFPKLRVKFPLSGK